MIKPVIFDCRAGAALRQVNAAANDLGARVDWLMPLI
jgi:hypothetical protein